MEEIPKAAGAARHRPKGLRALARATRFSTKEIKLMYRGFKQECPSGLVDEEAFTNIFNQFFPLGDATQYAQLVFKTIKHKQTGNINFEEYLDFLSRVGRGSVEDKLSWMFSLYDLDGDGRISRDEMLRVVQATYEMLGRAVEPPVHRNAATDHVDRIFHLMDADADEAVSREELARWCARDPALLRSLDAFDTVLCCQDSGEDPLAPRAAPSPHSLAPSTSSLDTQLTREANKLTHINTDVKVTGARRGVNLTDEKGTGVRAVVNIRNDKMTASRADTGVRVADMKIEDVKVHMTGVRAGSTQMPAKVRNISEIDAKIKKDAMRTGKDFDSCVVNLTGQKDLVKLTDRPINVKLTDKPVIVKITDDRQVCDVRVTANEARGGRGSASQGIVTVSGVAEPPPPVPARITACTTEKVQRKPKRKHRRPSPPRR